MTNNKNEIILQFDRLKPDSEFDAPVPVRVKFNTEDSEVFDFINPITDKNLAELRWYLESYWSWPSDIDDERAREVEGNLPKWGKALMDGIIQKSADAMRLFGRFSESDGERMLTIDTTEPRILRLPWELLRDEGGYLFSEKISVRRRMHKVKPQDIQPFDLPVRILMVTCRPDGAGFIDPRSIATPLLEALDSMPEQFDVEFLRPPTLKALDERLRDESQPRVHIVHFDGHGVYDKGVGLGFLLFEDESHQKHLVDAEQLGTLLNRSGIPLMVLNACQSAQPDDKNPFASVASRLIESGVGGVVAMNYSVLVETAKRFTKEFYGALARGQSANAAMDTARRDLFADTKRLTFTRPHQEEVVIVHLQDWFLPALYQQAEEITPFTTPPQPSPKGEGVNQSPSPFRRGARGEVLRASFPPAPLHGFKGRARELLDLERAFATRNTVVLHGFGGQGKTSLATQAAEWFTRTGLFARAAFISFETGASFDFVLNELGNALVEENFQIYDGDKVEAIAASLRENPALVVFDNFESALPNGNAPMAELQLLLDAAAKWFAGFDKPREERAGLLNQRGSRLLITTRNTDIPHPAFTPSKTCLHKELSGLAASDALELAASILEAYDLPRPPRVPLEELLNFLKGHPLSLQLALPQLRDHSAEQLVAEYQTILPQMKAGAAKERNESLEVSLKFSLDRLGADTMNWLSRFIVFESGAWEPWLLRITEISEDKWNELKPKLISTALIRLEELNGVTVPFVHFHPTLVPYLRTLPESQTDYELRNTKYWQEYYQLASALYQMDTQNPIQARAIVARELPNLKRALKLTLAAGALDEAVEFADSINRFLDVFGRWRERDEVAALVEKYTSTQGNTDGKITQRETLLESGRGERLLQQGRAAEAEQVFRALLSRLEGDAEYDTRYDQTMILRNIGDCLRGQGSPSQATDFYRRAIVLAEGLEQDINVKNQLSNYHIELATALRDTGQYVNARAEYEVGLALAKETDNDRNQGVALGQLGTLAMTQGDLNEARKRHGEAQMLFHRMGENQHEALAWANLGNVAIEAKDWDEAEKYYKQAYALFESVGDLGYAARVCNQMYIVSNSAGRLEEAERWCMRAIELKEKHSTPSDLASSLSNLASLYLAQNRLDEAETYARRALAIKETLDLSSQPWTTYNILAELAEKRGRMDEVREWRRKEQESFAAFAGNTVDMKQYEGLINAVATACQGNEQAIAQVEPTLQSMEKGDETNRAFAKSARRMLAGERDIASLTDGMARTSGLIVRRILQVLNGDNGQSSTVNSQPQPQQQEQGMTLPQLLELVERAAGGDKELGGQLFTAFQQMAKADDAFQSALGNALLRVLDGEREPDLSQLPDEVASAVRGMLGRLKNK